ncbi:MAG TPA: hypothetical protein VK277_01245 [Acidimicrobiales bacterium]|nr:hypothetical protein [Acidimicrobiales bacterium]
MSERRRWRTRLAPVRPPRGEAARPPGAAPALWPAYPPHRYLGQLDPAFQAKMAELRAGATLADCEWYHTFELPDGTVVPGAWDLRGGEAAYLGGTEFAGQRVLELGPASGYLTFHMEREGADVVAFEGGFDVPVDLLPVAGLDMWEEQRTIMRTVDRVHNAWWYMHRAYASSARLVHGRIYELPGDLGEFDVAVFGAILLHLREPWGALAEAARHTRHRIVVTELVQDEEAPLESNILRFSPLATHEITNWWAIYPGAVVAMLERLGFPHTTVTRHEQSHHLGHRMDEPPVRLPMFTVVGERG